jgi:hypothetical protein
MIEGLVKTQSFCEGFQVSTRYMDKTLIQSTIYCWCFACSSLRCGRWRDSHCIRAPEGILGVTGLGPGLGCAREDPDAPAFEPFPQWRGYFLFLGLTVAKAVFGKA